MNRVTVNEMQVGKHYLFEHHAPHGVARLKGPCVRIEGVPGAAVPVLRVVPAHLTPAQWPMQHYVACTDATCPNIYLSTAANKAPNHVGPRIRAHLAADYQTRVRRGMDHIQGMQRRGVQRHEKTVTHKRRRLMPQAADFDTETFTAPYGGRRRV